MKFAHPRKQGRQNLRFAVLCAAAAVFFPAQAKDLTFEQAFHTKGEPDATHFEATYVSHGATHQVEVWRDGERRIKRRTDDAAETYALRKSGVPDFHLSALDLKRKIRTDIDRDNLYRIGSFADWFDLGHGLRHPVGEYRLVAASAPAGSEKPVEPCTWYELTQPGRFTRLCWSARSSLPMLIQTENGHTIWRVTKVDHKPIAATVFQIQDAGFIRTDANQDIERD
ncbi:hypothetical protein ACI48D_10765 [Massilia sp. LXY-6]|uniref:hypothetical protein n=1 Tax=Massilia sp. LXY-6 TaxID=3379823 RepID=UPI003EE107F8